MTEKAEHVPSRGRTPRLAASRQAILHRLPPAMDTVTKEEDCGVMKPVQIPYPVVVVLVSEGDAGFVKIAIISDIECVVSFEVFEVKYKSVIIIGIVSIFTDTRRAGL
jgi:hypothetical protein